MPNLPHLLLPRAEWQLPRKRTGFGRPPVKDYRHHGPLLGTQLENVLQQFRIRRPPAGINPDLILRVQLDPRSAVSEEDWERCGLSLLSIDENRTLILFSSDEDLLQFRQRLEEYRQRPRAEQRTAPFTSIFACIDEIGDVRPQDRIGRLFRSRQIMDPRHF